MTSLGQLYGIVGAAEEFDCVEDLVRDRAEAELRRLKRDIMHAGVDGSLDLDLDEDAEPSPPEPEIDQQALTEGQITGLLAHELGATEIRDGVTPG